MKMTQEGVINNGRASDAEPATNNHTHGINSLGTENSTTAAAELESKAEDAASQSKHEAPKTAGTGNSDQEDSTAEVPKKKDSKLKKMWTSVGLDVGTLLMMFK